MASEVPSSLVSSCLPRQEVTLTLCHLTKADSLLPSSSKNLFFLRNVHTLTDLCLEYSKRHAKLSDGDKSRCQVCACVYSISRGPKCPIPKAEVFDVKPLISVTQVHPVLHPRRHCRRQLCSCSLSLLRRRRRRLRRRQFCV